MLHVQILPIGDNAGSATPKLLFSKGKKKLTSPDDLTRGARAIPAEAVVSTSIASPTGSEKLVYLEASGLSTRPSPITELELGEMSGVGPDEMTGSLVLTVWINSQGGVAATETLYSDMPKTLLDAATIAFSRMRFIPGYLEGRPVASVMRVQIEAEDFRLPAQ